MYKFTILFALLITFAFADIADYTKSAKRTFNAIEGKVPKISVEMDPAEYERLYNIAQINQEADIIIRCNTDASCLENFETKVTLTYELEDDKKVFEKVTFKTGGNYGRAHDRVGFNLKLKGDDLLFDRKQLHVRPDATDPTHMKSKVAYDLLNNWGIPSVQETYCEFYLNGEYFGLYLLQDAVKTSWIKKTYDLPADEEVETLFYCKKDGVNLAKGDVCYNQNDKVANYTEPFKELLEKIEASTTVEDLEKFMNVDLAMKNLAIEFLFGSFDHYIIQGHNFYMYQRKDGIWDMLLVDFDAELGSGLYVYTKFILGYDIEDFGYRIKFEDMPKPGKKLLEPAYFNDNTYFKQTLRNLMVTGFNPDSLYKRIDELKAFLTPYVKKTVTPREDGRLPGVINFKGDDNTHTMEDFEAGTEFEPVNPVVPSLKGWIKNRFEFACEEYGFDPEEIRKEAAEFRGEEYIKPEEDRNKVEFHDKDNVSEDSNVVTITITSTVVVDEIETVDVDVENDVDEDSAVEITESAEEDEDSADDKE